MTLSSAQHRHDHRLPDTVDDADTIRRIEATWDKGLGCTERTTAIGPVSRGKLGAFEVQRGDVDIVDDGATYEVVVRFRGRVRGRLDWDIRDAAMAIYDNLMRIKG